MRSSQSSSLSRGAAASFFYVQGADQRAAEGAEFQQVYVVTTDVPEGTPGEAIADFIEVDELPAIAIQPDIVTDLADSRGSSRMPISFPASSSCRRDSPTPQELAADGEVAVPEGMQEITIALSVERVVGGAVTPGSTVGVVYTSNTTRLAANDRLPRRSSCSTACW